MTGHARMMTEYRAARCADEMARNAAVGAYGPDSEEWRDYTRDHPLITFRAWLTSMREER